MKKLNRKGFTLIELLAVIVILAIVLVVAVPSFLNNIEQAREASLANYAKAVVESYNNAATQDMLNPGAYLKGAEVTNAWQCFSSIPTNDGKTLADVLDLSKADVNLSENKVTTDTNGKLTSTAASCSAIRLKDNGSAEVILIGASEGNLGKKGAGKFKSSKGILYSVSTNGTPETADFVTEKPSTE